MNLFQINNLDIFRIIISFIISNGINIVMKCLFFFKIILNTKSEILY